MTSKLSLLFVLATLTALIAAAIVRRLVEHGRCTVVVLGGDHDLSDEARAAGAEDVRVAMVGYPSDN